MSLVLPPGPEGDFGWTDDEQDGPRSPAFDPGFDAVTAPPIPESDAPVEVVDALWRWLLAAKQRKAAEADELARMLHAEDRFLADLVAVHGPGVVENGGRRSFAIDAAIALGVSERSAAHRLRVGRTVRYRLPRVWALFGRGECGFAQLDVIVRQAEALDPDRFAEYDEAAAHAVTDTPHSRLKRHLHGVRECIQRVTAAERRRTAEQQRRVEIEPCGDGLAALTLVGPAEDLIAIDTALGAAAVAAHGGEHGGPDEQRGLGALTYDIAVDVLVDGMRRAAGGDPGSRVPQRKGVAVTAHVTVPVLTLLGESDEPADLEGYGPIDRETALRLTARAPSFRRILTHPVSGVRLTLDRTTYRPPADLREWVRIRDEYCGMPGCRRPAKDCDLDHSQEWQHGGRTQDVNLMPLSREHHLLKGTGLWNLVHPPGRRPESISPTGIRHPVHRRPPADPAPPHLRPPAADAAGDCPF